MKHAFHPIQGFNQVQYLGLMRCGPKLNRNTPYPLLGGFRSIKRLHLLGLYQSFKKEDLEWLVESLPELCRIEAEKYNISEEGQTKDVLKTSVKGSARRVQVTEIRSLHLCVQIRNSLPAEQLQHEALDLQLADEDGKKYKQVQFKANRCLV
jgi:hypothetical protein